MEVAPGFLVRIPHLKSASSAKLSDFRSEADLQSHATQLRPFELDWHRAVNDGAVSKAHLSCKKVVSFAYVFKL
jgi:hypothetical protein